jgi:hypothetical protein
MRNVARSFTKDGRRYYVPSDSFWAWRDFREGWRAQEVGRRCWLDLRQRILQHWNPHLAFKTFSPKAHVAALRPHLAHNWFAVIDLAAFYDHVTRTKVHRALESIGLSRAESFRLAGESTIQQGPRCSLPRGFRQSSLLATLVLERSLFGSYLRRQIYESTITVFSDDIILSSDDKESLNEEYYAIIQLLERSHFPVHPLKSQSPRDEVIAFNICLSRGGLRFTDERMWGFLTRAREIIGDSSVDDRANLYEKLYGNYVECINSKQARQLRASLNIGDTHPAMKAD